MSIDQRLYSIEQRYEELEQLIADPSVMAKMEQWQKYTKEHADLYEIVEKIRSYRALQKESAEALEMSETENDPEMREMFRDEHEKLKKQIKKYNRDLGLSAKKDGSIYRAAYPLLMKLRYYIGRLAEVLKKR